MMIFTERSEQGWYMVVVHDTPFGPVETLEEYPTREEAERAAERLHDDMLWGEV